MKTNIEKIENGVEIHINVSDPKMEIYDFFEKVFDDDKNIKSIKKAKTFETPLYRYEYKGILFTLLYDEMSDETFIFIDSKYDYKVIQNLIEKIEIK